MSENIQKTIEKTTNEMLVAIKHSVLSTDEAKALVTKRRSFEYALLACNATINDYFKYINFENSYHKLIMMRAKRIGLKKIPPILKYGPVARIRTLFDRALSRHPWSVSGWVHYGDYVRHSAQQSPLRTIMASALGHHPCHAGLWVLAAAWEAEGGNVMAARGWGKSVKRVWKEHESNTCPALLQRGLRFLPASPRLWREYVRLELIYREKVGERYDTIAEKIGEKRKRSDESASPSSPIGIITRGDIVEAIINEAMKRIPTPTFAESLLEVLSHFEDVHKFTEMIKQHIPEMPSDAMPWEGPLVTDAERPSVCQNCLKEERESEDGKENGNYTKEKKERLLQMYQKGADANLLGKDDLDDYISLVQPEERETLLQHLLASPVFSQYAMLWIAFAETKKEKGKIFFDAVQKIANEVECVQVGKEYLKCVFEKAVKALIASLSSHYLAFPIAGLRDKNSTDDATSSSLFGIEKAFADLYSAIETPQNVLSQLAAFTLEWWSEWRKGYYQRKREQLDDSKTSGKEDDASSTKPQKEELVPGVEGFYEKLIWLCEQNAKDVDSISRCADALLDIHCGADKVCVKTCKGFLEVAKMFEKKLADSSSVLSHNPEIWFKYFSIAKMHMANYDSIVKRARRIVDDMDSFNKLFLQ